MTDLPECLCPLIDITRFHGKPEFILGDPRGTGCPIHETQEMRDAVQRAMNAARYGERASGGPIDSSTWTCPTGEDGPEPLILPNGARFLAGLKRTEFTLNGTFDADPSHPIWPSAPNPVKVSWQTPANRWHAWLWRLSTVRAFGWIKPRMTTRKFVGNLEPWDSTDTINITARPEEDAQ